MSKRSKRRKWELVRSDELTEIISLLGMEFYEKTIKPIENAVEFLESIRSRTELIPGSFVPHVAMREETFQILMSAFHSRLKQKYNEALSTAGQAIGYSFADDLISFLKRNYLLPRDEDTLIRIWMLFDTNAGWGDFKSTFDEVKKQIQINVKNCFLARSLTRNTTMHAPFLKGYINGVSWELLKQYPRIFKREFGVERKYFEPIAPVVMKVEIEDLWIFRINLKNEELKLPFDYLYKAKDAVQEEDYDTTILNTRRAVESAFKLKVGLSLDEIIHLPSIFRIYRDQGIPFDYNSAKDIYGKTSRKIHPHKVAVQLKEKYTKLVDQASNVLRDIELYEMTEEKQKIIRESCRKL